MHQPRKIQKVRGVYEHPPNSGLWWTQYFVAGRRHRERAGSKSNAIALYRKRKTEALTQAKLPELTRRHVTLGELFDDAIAFAQQHHKSVRDILQKATTARPKLGSLWAANVTHADLEAWIDSREVDKSTFNRYKSFFSLCYREGMRSGKVKDNPARLMRRRREPSGRSRFLTESEYGTLCDDMAARAAEYEARGWPGVARRWRRRRRAFIVSVWTGMRRGEQFSLSVDQVNWARNEIQLRDTKNGDSREIPMVPEVRQAIEEELADRPASARDPSLARHPERSAQRAVEGPPHLPLPQARHSEHRSESPYFVFARERNGSAAGTMEMAWFDKLLAAHKITDSPGSPAGAGGRGGYTWHNNRHTFCSWLAIAGTPLRTIQDLAGHRSIQTTARYAHLSPSSKRTALDAVATAHRKPKVTEITKSRKRAN